VDDYKISVIMFKKGKPKMHDDNWIKASKLMNELSKKNTQFTEHKKQQFCYLVDEIYKEE